MILYLLTERIYLWLQAFCHLMVMRNAVFRLKCWSRPTLCPPVWLASGPGLMPPPHPSALPLHSPEVEQLLNGGQYHLHCVCVSPTEHREQGNHLVGLLYWEMSSASFGRTDLQQSCSPCGLCFLEFCILQLRLGSSAILVECQNLLLTTAAWKKKESKVYEKDCAQRMIYTWRLRQMIYKLWCIQTYSLLDSHKNNLYSANKANVQQLKHVMSTQQTHSVLKKTYHAQNRTASTNKYCWH